MVLPDARFVATGDYGLYGSEPAKAQLNRYLHLDQWPGIS